MGNILETAVHYDIVVPVYNNLSYVKDCLEAIVTCTQDVPHTLYIMDDGSDGFTRGWLREFANGRGNVQLHLNEENLGFVKNCNKGMQLGGSRYVVLVNSDVVVTPGWLFRLVECAESDERIASVNPFTNYASLINIPMPPGTNFYAMDEFLAGSGPRSVADIVTGVGFCMMLRRSALEHVGYFDEVYGMGYCEESDLCMRLTTNGYRTVVCGSCYVYHKGRASFENRAEHYIPNRKIFDSRWSEEYKRQLNIFLKTGSIQRYRILFSPYTLPMTQTRRYKLLKKARKLSREALILTKEALKKIGAKKVRDMARKALNPTAFYPDYNTTYLLMLADGLENCRPGMGASGKPKSSGPSFNVLSRTGRPSVTYVLHSFGLSGGILSVIQLTNELVKLGIDARIALLKTNEPTDSHRYYAEPIFFDSLYDMAKYFPKSDIVVATYWITAYWVHKLAGMHPGTIPVYFLQDYESWFFPQENSILREKVINTYNLIPNKIVKSDWLAEMLSKHECKTRKIPLGMDLGVFHPRDILKNDGTVALAMTRPATPRRGFSTIVDAMGLLKKRRPDVDIVFFGEDDLSEYNIPYVYKNIGKIRRQEDLAKLYSGANVFFDGSDFQGFGRTALESMACGTPTVLTNVGGVTEYASDGNNCLTIPPKDPVAAAEAMARVLQDKECGDRLVRGGLETVKRYCHKREGRETLEYFEELLRARQRSI